MSIIRRHPLLLFAGNIIIVFILFCTFYFKPFQPLPPAIPLPLVAKEPFTQEWNFSRDARNLLMSDEQCTQAFPDLYREIERAVDYRRGDHVTLKELDDVELINGHTRVLLYDQQLYILATGRKVINTRDYASLLALHRAVVTSPEVLPNTEFLIMVDDKTTQDDHANPKVAWAFSRKEAHKKLWLMPDFGYWSWPEPKVGAYAEVQMKAQKMDEKVPWARKISKLIWRGNMMNLAVREQLMEISAGKEWSDVKILDWGTEAKGQSHLLLTMDQHCQYKFVAHTEGVSYSARLENLQNCHSVVVTHKLQWIQHHHHLMLSSGPAQNYVEVAEDFTDLDAAMDRLLANDEEAERIAANNVRQFREHYLTPAAETCYWRKLIRGWASVSFEPEFFNTSRTEEAWRGVPVESYVLMRALDWHENRRLILRREGAASSARGEEMSAVQPVLRDVDVQEGGTGKWG